jgi:peptidoglycan/LPS O-acetylase OafA/YrhL
METMEIMNNEIETTEEIVNASSGKGFKVAAGVSLTVVVGVAAYRYIVKPIMAKIKARKEQREEDKVVDIAEFRETESEEN